MERSGIRFCDQNRIAIDPDWFFDSDRDCDDNSMLVSSENGHDAGKATSTQDEKAIPFSF